MKKYLNCSLTVVQKTIFSIDIRCSEKIRYMNGFTVLYLLLLKEFKKSQKLSHLTQTNNDIRKNSIPSATNRIGENLTWKFEFILKLLIFKVVNITLGYPVFNFNKTANVIPTLYYQVYLNVVSRIHCTELYWIISPQNLEPNHASIQRTFQENK